MKRFLLDGLLSAAGTMNDGASLRDLPGVAAMLVLVWALRGARRERNFYERRKQKF
jgi:hypothetical protein